MTDMLFKDVDFLRAAYMPESICDRLRDFFEENTDDHHKGYSGGKIQEQVKKSTDLIIENTPFYSEYFWELQKIIDMYIKEYPTCDEGFPFGITEGCQLQRYHPSEGYYAWHCERDNNLPRSQDRHLVFMTYLNDVNDAGETEFYHQKLKVKPKKGLTVIWPADWTFRHRGIPSPTETKWICTGWLNYYTPENWDEKTYGIKENINESR
jgi:hypothetical protein